MDATMQSDYEKFLEDLEKKVFVILSVPGS